MLKTGVLTCPKKHIALENFGTVEKDKIIDVYGSKLTINDTHTRIRSYAKLLLNNINRIICDASYLNVNKKMYKLSNLSNLIFNIEVLDTKNELIVTPRTHPIYRNDNSKAIKHCIDMLYVFGTINKNISMTSLRSNNSVRFTLAEDYVKSNLKQELDLSLDETAMSTVIEILRTKLKSLTDEQNNLVDDLDEYRKKI
ncbi:hypothetical protein YenMTG1_107 [Yersinia phage vB_YenM_TG1]|uniref:Uncharacterized protein n=1 Tax=Yersinia phage vB_YenM_TG1 TaxID=1589265 RepID=A0A0B4ZXA7_9CAUD|nr:hypothetical protein AVV33_gp107 [Yersinia phage vB_YenM_TG1]AJD81917.1 hypothetical protein YenMTG1_107 [Yersinia phage vB_YenM_TG1]